MATPKGIITAWYGTSGSIPTGWQICDGTNDTPDLRSQFIAGASSNTEVGTTSGCATHTHSVTGLVDGGTHAHDVSGDLGNAGEDGASSSSGAYAVSVGHNHSYSFSLGNDGGHTHTATVSGSSVVIPPYYLMYYIMKL